MTQMFRESPLGNEEGAGSPTDSVACERTQLDHNAKMRRVAPILMFDPGTKEWARRFKNRPGTQSLSGDGKTGIVALDHDMLLTFSIGAYRAAAGNLMEMQQLIHVH
jgi:hypothetical protein